MIDSKGESIIKFGTFQKKLLFVCGSGWGISNALQVCLGILLIEISEEWGVGYLEQSFVSICMMIGIFIGSYFWGILADKRGRRVAFNKILLFIAGGLMIGVFSPNIWMLAPCFILVGFGQGGCYTVDGNVFLEYCPPEKQHLLTSLSALSSLGCCFPPAITLIYLSLDFPYRWRFLLGTLSLITILLSIPRFWIKETPMFLLTKHKTTKVFELIQEVSPTLEDKSSLIERILEASPKQKNDEKPVKEQLKMLFLPPLRRLTLLYIPIWACSSFTFAGLSSFLPTILIRAGISQSGPQLYETMLLQQLAGIPGIILATYLVGTRFGRKKGLVLSQVCGCVLIFGFLQPNFIALLVMSVFYYFFENSFLAIQFCITSETFPPEVRGTATGLFTSSSMIGSIIAPFVAAIILENSDGNFGFIIVMVSNLAIAAVCSLGVIETRNLSRN